MMETMTEQNFNHPGDTMNRYTEAGIIDDARQGKRVVVFHHGSAESRAAFHDVFESAADDEIRQVHRGNGAERVDFVSGGSIHFQSTSTGRPIGMTADVAFVSGWNDLSHTCRDDVLAMIASSPTGELIRA